MKESKFRQDLSKRLRDQGCVVLNIEDKFQSGIPDTHIYVPDDQVIVAELKIAEVSETAGIRLDLAPEQISTLEHLSLVHKKTFVLSWGPGLGYTAHKGAHARILERRLSKFRFLALCLKQTDGLSEMVYYLLRDGS